MRYLHTMVRVKDLEASLHFYCDLLGLQEVRRTENEAGRFTLDQPWSCVVEDREGTGIPQFHFTVGLRTFRTSPAGTLLG